MPSAPLRGLDHTSKAHRHSESAYINSLSNHFCGNPEHVFTLIRGSRGDSTPRRTNLATLQQLNQGHKKGGECLRSGIYHLF